MSKKRNHPIYDTGEFKAQFDKAKRKILLTQDICGICGKPVDKSLKYPHPLSPTIDHIIPINKGGHPCDINNLQLAHFCCNRQKSDKITDIQNNTPGKTKTDVLSNRVLPLSADWMHYCWQE